MQSQTISNEELSSREIYQDIRDNHRLCKAEVNGKILTLPTKSNISDLGLIETFVERVMSSDDLGYKKIIKTSLMRESMIHFSCLKLHLYFLQMNSFITTIYEHDSYYFYSEKVTLFYEVCNELNLHLRRFEKPYYFLADLQKYQAELFNDMIELIRRKSKSPEFKQLLRNRQLNSDRMHTSIVEYIHGLFSICSSITVIRVDLAYLSIVDDSGDLNGQGISLEQACLDRDQFIRNMKHNKIFKHKIGLVWKIEHTELKGYHFHWLFFFKGARVQNSINKSFEIGKYWRDVITQKKGIFFSCNAKMHQYRYLGIGRIHASSPNDAALRENLYNRVVRYLTKRDQFLKVKLGEGYRIFGRGEVPEKNNAGRPRLDYEGLPDMHIDLCAGNEDVLS